MASMKATPPRVGTILRAMRGITKEMVLHWRYGATCGSVGNGVNLGTRLRVTQVRTTPGEQWVQLELPGRTPRTFLQLTLKEAAGLFRR